jgi:hypothetical protein
VNKITGLKKRETLGKQFIDFVAPKHQETALLRYKMRLMDEKIPKIPVEINASLN